MVRQLYMKGENGRMDEDMNDFLASFGITPEGAGTGGEQDPPEGDKPPAGNEPPPADGDGAGTPPPDGAGNEPPPAGNETPPATPPVDQKANQAFAAMRTENATLKSTLADVAKVLGIDGASDPVAMAAAIREKALEAQSKQTNIPVEILQKLDRLENLETQFTHTQLQQQAMLGFQKVAETYKLDNDGVIAFAAQLLQENINPYETPVDLVQEYRNRNWEKIVQAEVAAAVRAEQERAANAGSHGSDPNQNQGGLPGATDKINTVKDLDNLISKW